MKRALRLTLGAALAVALLLATAIGYRLRTNPAPGQAPVLAGAPPGLSQVARGAYLARAADCVACHTTAGGQPYAGGLAFKLPFGRLYSSNITPDPETGIGRWSDDDFVRALHEGVRQDGQHLYPAFPYTAYTQLSRDDVLAIKAYLFSLPAVKQRTPEPELGFPFNQRWGMAFWNAVFLDQQRFETDTRRPAAWNRGAYLANSLAHCAECHTPRNLGFALDHARELAGSSLEGWAAPNITSDRQSGIGAWSDQDLVNYLRTGHAAGRGTAGGPMGEAVANSLQYLSPDDVHAMVTYLRSVPPVAGDPGKQVAPLPPRSVADSTPIAPPANTPADLRAGLRLFESACASCHRWDGPGRQIPQAALLQLRSVNDPTGQTLTKAVLQGVNLKLNGADVFMPAFKDSMSDTEIAQLANYVIGHFSGKTGVVTASDVAKQRTQ
ncbi:MAG: alcohol dehydrogenase [Roseateles depolymerans]|uniref:Alcohol dehydrogenase n=1 Tax=Roseateles depolymerans TaxID=76731 RepID=A0A2W5E629_9BURK|nr:MAG: alcohol dehydrogenase [Roseateles depolymerans]